MIIFVREGIKLESMSEIDFLTVAGQCLVFTDICS